MPQRGSLIIYLIRYFLKKNILKCPDLFIVHRLCFDTVNKIIMQRNNTILSIDKKQLEISSVKME